MKSNDLFSSATQRSLADGFVDGLRGPEHLLAQMAACIVRSNVTAAAS